MRDSDVLVINSETVLALLAGREPEVLEVIKKAYETHGKGDSSLPHSIFLRFPNSPDSRIIALPAYLGGETNSAGVKWISSFPQNLEQGRDRASAVLILNSPTTGRPKAILEGSIISAKRTAASAVLAAVIVDEHKSTTAGLVGCGLINFEIARFLNYAYPQIHTFITYDLNFECAQAFRERFQREMPGVQVKIVPDLDSIFRDATLISFATTAGKPYISSLKSCTPGTVVLGISLRDLSPDVILASDNVVDDIDHVCRAQTSLHLAEQEVGHRRFIRCALHDILNGMAPAKINESSITVFSPFGLGVLDIALGEYVYHHALSQGRGSTIESFFPSSWARTCIPS
jgi:2,3-diaminopropionate biosynthesis protein SbnB